MNATGPPSVHRRLDAAFAGVQMTPALQDLKEELRANLLERVDELTADGLEAPAAVDRAFAEIGDLRDVIGDVAAEPSRPDAVRVRPRPSFVVAVAFLSTVLAGAAAVVGLAAGEVVEEGYGVAAAAVAAVAAAAITFLSLRQETTLHYPSPTARSARYGEAAGIGLAGLGLAALAIARWPEPVLLGVGAAGTLIGALGLAALGASQTNRTKEWALAAAAEQHPIDRFSHDPAAAARFGIYLIAIWIVAVAVFVALSATVGFTWSWLALAVGLAVCFIVLARMLFPPHPEPDESSRR